MSIANKDRLITFFIGKLGSGKTFLAETYTSLRKTQEPTIHLIDVSNVMRSFVGENATREQLQDFKVLMKDNPRFLVDRLHNYIDASQSYHIVMAGLRELWIYKELVNTYKLCETLVVDSDPELRRARRKLSPEEFVKQEAKDDALGVSELITAVRPTAIIMENNFENGLC